MKTQRITTWSLHRAGFPACEGNVPCSLYSILLDCGYIPDPFFQDNEYEIAKLSDEDCDFTAAFFADGSMLDADHLTLRFLGVDTLATVFVNEKRVGEADNMHRVWEFDVKNAAVPGENVIRVHFSSPTVYMEKMQDAHYVFGDFNSGKGIAHLRKSLCMSGWDWAPRLPDMGLFRPVELVSWNGARIEDVLLHQEHGKDTVRLDAVLTLSEAEDAVARLTVTAPDGNISTATFEEGRASLTLQNPKLWWPNGLGKQPLYGVKVTLQKGNTPTDTWERRIGLRTLEVSRAKDHPEDPDSGEEFCFVCNGQKFFAMGADYIPEDSILARLSKSRTEKLLRGCVEANYNCLRVWGGGFYPHDDFFNLCDELGLVVWQDFMFACINVWMNDAFTANVTEEAVENVRRLRHHACLGLFCGNNEMELAFVDGWDKNPLSDVNQVKNDYLLLYENILPNICRKYCPDVFYWPASPSSGGGFVNPNDEKKGDVHYWGAWHGSIPFESYRKYRFRFLSEFGFESFPNGKTIRYFAKSQDLNPFSYIMESHQKCKGGNTKILTYLADKYLYPTNFDSLFYTSQLLQADAIRYGVEHFRRYRGTCMGAVYWQLNDCWPVASWSSVDYFNRWKALQYASKRFFAPTLLSAHENGAVVTMNVSNEQRTAFVGTMTLRLLRADCKVLEEKTWNVSVDPMSAQDVTTQDYTERVKGRERDVYLAYVLRDGQGSVVSGGSLLFTKPKYFRFLNPNVTVDIAGQGGQFTLTVRADAYARAVEIDFKTADMHLSDNYFDITDTEPRIIQGVTEDPTLTCRQLQEQLTVRSVFSLSTF